MGINLSSVLGKSVRKAYKTTAVSRPVVDAKLTKELSKDIFVRRGNELGKMSLKELAREFRNTVILPYSLEWTTKLPANGEDGYSVLAKQLGVFRQALSTKNAKDTENFVKLTLGSDYCPALLKGAEDNSCVKAFVELIEEKMGKTIRAVLPD